MNSFQFELLLLNLFYAGLVTIIIAVFNRFGYVHKKNPLQIQVLTVTFAVLVLIACIDFIMLPITLNFATLNVFNLVSFSLLGILVSFVSELLIAFAMKKRNILNYNYDDIDGTTTTTTVNNRQEPTADQIPVLRLNKKKLLFHTIFIGVAVMEEIVFRGFVLQYLLLIGTPLSFSLIISSVAFGVNHFFRGPITVIQKSAAGAIFGILTYQAGFSLLVPISTHVGENYLILLYDRFKRDISNKKSGK